MSDSALPAIAERALKELEKTLRAVLNATDAMRRSTKWQQLQTGLSSLSRSFNPDDPDTASSEKLEIETFTSEIMGFLREYMVSPAMLSISSTKEASFKASMPDVENAEPDAQTFIDMINAIGLGTTVREVPGGFDFVCTLGGVDKALLTLAIRDRALDFVVDLSSATSAMGHLEKVAQEITGEEGQLQLKELEVETFAGVIAVGMRVSGEGKLELHADLRKELKIDAKTPSGPIVVRLEGTSPLLRFENDIQGRGGMELHVGRLKVRMPQDTLPEQEAGAQAPLELQVAGLHGVMRVAAGDERIRIDELSLGNETAVLKLGTKTVGMLDLNARQKRRVDVALVPDKKTGNVDLQLESDLALAVAWMEDTWQFKAAKGAKIRFIGEDNDDPSPDSPLFKNLQGDISISMGASKVPLQIPPGATLFQVDEDALPEPVKNPLMRMFAVR